MADIDRATSLGSLLADKRDDYKGTPQQFTGADVALELSVSSAYISKIERGLVDKVIPEWNSRRQLALLKAYKFTDEEITRIAMRFNLDLPNVTNVTSGLEAGQVARLNDVKLVTLRVVGDTTAGDTLTVLNDTLQGVSKDSCIVVPTSGGVLACEKVRAEYNKVSYLIFTMALKPQENDMVLYQFKDTGAWVICLYMESPPKFPVLAYDGSAVEIVQQPDARLEFRGVHIGEYGKGRRSERAPS